MKYLFLRAPTKILELLIVTRHGEPLPVYTPKLKRTRVTANIYADVGSCNINGHSIKASILENGVSKYTALKIYMEHFNMKIVVPNAFLPPKGKTSKKKEAAYLIMCVILQRHPDILLAQLGHQLANHCI